MPMHCALDWRHGLVSTTLTQDPEGSIRLALAHGPDELVIHLTPDCLDALVWAGFCFPRPPGRPPWALATLTCC
jgi:hypothetical protein